VLVAASGWFVTLKRFTPTWSPRGDDDLLRSIWSTFTGVDLAETIAYLALSLGVAFTGSLAAVFLVALVQPEHELPFAGRLLNLHGGIELHVAVFAIATATFALMRWQAARLGARLVARYGMGLRCKVHAQLIEAPLASLADVTSAEIANVLTYNVEIIVQGFGALQQLLLAGVTSFVSLGFAFWVSPPLMLAAPALACVGLMTSRAFGREQAIVSRQYVADMTRLFWHSEDFPRRLRHVRSFEREDAEKASYGAVSARLYQGYRRQIELVASGRLMLELLAAAGVSAIFLFARLWHGIDQPSLIAVCLLLGRVLPYALSTRQSFQQLRSAQPAFELWRKYMKMSAAQRFVSSRRVADYHSLLRIDRMRIVPPLAGIDIHALNLVAGELCLISGESGIGKSSLIDVLSGMTKPAFFSARLGDRPLGFDEYREVVRKGAYIGQNVRPWQHSVRDCLLWADPEATDESMHKALSEVGFDQRLMRRAGLDTALQSASSRLSGGELQRLLLAQVILRQPFLALLDEATSALDASSEIAVLSAVKRLLPQTILMVVSHRNSVAALADQRLVIGNDRVTTIERGVCTSLNSASMSIQPTTSNPEHLSVSL
jgi:ABC-type multidrug transport system fused ATPase/permease subunit